MQVSTPLTTVHESFDKIQTLRLKKALQNEGEPQGRLIDSTDMDAPMMEDRPKVGRFLDVKA